MPKDLNLPEQLARQIITIPAEDIPATLTRLCAHHDLSRLIHTLNDAALSADPGTRQTALSAIEHLGFL